jgi:hypothetical protein
MVLSSFINTVHQLLYIFLDLLLLSSVLSALQFTSDINNLHKLQSASI